MSGLGALAGGAAGAAMGGVGGAAIGAVVGNALTGGGFLGDHHYDIPWCVIGTITIFYHANLTTNISVQYDERSVFGSHGQYAVWLGTSPRSFTVWANMVAGNGVEVAFNVAQVMAAYSWTQESPPSCKYMKAPIPLGLPLLHLVSVRLETYDSAIEEGTHMLGSTLLGAPIQVTLSLSLKECKPI
jgi:hypothetical protein